MRTGQTAPDFRLPDHEGNVRSLGELLARGPVVLFFYPAASSPVCTAEACHFRDLGRSFEALGAQRVGISTDTTDKQSHFALQRSFDYPLLADSDASVAGQFGVRRGGWLMRRRRRQEISNRSSHAAKRGILRQLLSVKRTTFVIDRDRVVRLVVTSERAHVHADKALDYLRYLA
ncbi:MAG: peroxiredoxin [Rhodococcus fascians]|uniref:peroxiredoxin n=1 Tax=Nocardiaceae TaxID=85025 RepID=UPI0004758325|nr:MULTISPECIES: peroxiredoxin [Rhodococcus]OZC55714.1 peroxiredoxin [Rhodococcus sp. 06-621-2]OZC92846.1 peroxiredoxin [Rhodococcus sp. 06-418-1B]OZD07590.1 peroxiredoxin [Rhodococcus sp. 06-156-4C]OZD17200.1 peroxiredoxin [Rhodococcus sp. 06-156-3C]OZD18538.1 peroxiredoxin [Rhodococcus sp. 06-156-4a]